MSTNFRPLSLFLLLAAAIILAAAACGGSPAPAPGAGRPIVFNDLDWTSAQLQNRIAQYIVEKGYGHPTKALFGSTLPLFQGLRKGDSDVTMEIWLPNQVEAWEEAQTAGEVASAGESLSKIWQSAFVIPAYLQEEYPDLDSVEDLKEERFKTLFATAETGGKARLVSCLIGWACESVNQAQVESYGLAEHIHIVNPGGREIANSELFGLYADKQPWLGYQDSVNDPVLMLDLARLEEPEYSDECWLTTKACAYEDATILIGINPDLPARAPEVVDMLRKWDMSIEVYTELAVWQIKNEADYIDTAVWWLNDKADVWSQWVTEEAAAKIKAALEAGERAEGWPEE